MSGNRKRNTSAESQATIGEMMLARSIIEEKNEIIDRKDLLIRDLAARLQDAEHHADELAAALSEMQQIEELLREEERQNVLIAVLSDVVAVISAWEELHGAGSSGLATRIIQLFEERYGLRVIDEVPTAIVPELHQVVEVKHAEDGRGSIEFVEKGYRFGDTVIRPALVRVVLGVRTLRETHSPETGPVGGGLQ